jgi:uncharacterized protein (TIGR02145 family)
VISQTLVNNGTIPGVVTYTITPEVGSRIGDTVDYMVMVNIGDSVKVMIAASANNECEGTPVTFNATPVNGGDNPTFQWKVNAINAGMNNAVFSYIPVNGDIITCTVISSEPCTTGNPAVSNPIIMSVSKSPVVTFTPCFDTITTTNAKPIRLKGGIPLGGIYSGLGVSNGYFYPSLAGTGTKTITYSYTNFALCSASAQSLIHSFTQSLIPCGQPFTDIRDGKTYQTVQIGSQCWFAENLDYGTLVPSAQYQRDNCIPEKYVRSAFSVQGSALYQWDEIMQYYETPGLQGLCPPGWHVPTEADWNILFANWTNNAFAGAPLKYTGYSGFNAFLNGTTFFNEGWYFNDFATFFWSSTSHGPYKAWSHGMNEYNYSVSFYPSFRSNAFSVRCLRD